MRPRPGTELSLSDSERLLLQRLIEDLSGIYVASEPLLVQRLGRRLKELELDSFGAYCERLGLDAGEREELIERICTHETRFFREPQQLQYLEETLCPEWLREGDAGRRSRVLRVWSAGCASGEEPYTLAMILRSRLPSWQLEVLASDVCESQLEATRAATWPIGRASEIPDTYLRRFMLQGTGSLAGRMRAAPELQGIVRTARINLCGSGTMVEGSFDAIFCRNVLIYFREPARARVLDLLLGRLRPGGYLFLGHAEGLGAHARRIRRVGPIVYRTLPASEEPVA